MFEYILIVQLNKVSSKYFKNKKTPRECLNTHDGSVPTECQVLRNTFFECKRSIVSFDF